ncbi:hypothetical protein [Pseudomonas solani]|uniref:hypothetical protein n=1 Tax=Pseudomonas solani TaxID=2731552 RepID=UPI003C2CD044
MSKLLDLIAKQKALVAEIEKLQQDEKEMKVFELVKDLEALRDKYAYSEADFVSVVLSYYKHETQAKTRKNSSSAKTATEKKPQYRVKLDGKEVVLKESTQGKMKPELEEAVKKAGFTKYAEFLDSLIKKNKVETFDQLIEKLEGELVQ